MIVNLARAQQAQGHEIRLVSIDIEAPETSSFIEDRLGTTVHCTRLHPKGLRPLWSRSTIDHVLHGAHAVHLHSIWPTPNLFVAHRCLTLNIPYLLSIHGHLRPEALAIKSLKKRVGLALGYRKMLTGASAIHALNSSERDDVDRFGLKAPCEIIPNGIPADDFHHPPPRSVLSHRLPELGQAPYVLFLSRIHPPKGARDLAQAFCLLAQRHPDLHLVIAGSDFGGIEEVQEVVNEAGLTHRLHLPGFLAGEEKSAALAHATVFCLPSYHEGFSIAILEALAWGAPTLISTGCHFPELEKAQAGWIHQLGATDLHKTLLQILDHPQEALERGQRGRSWVMERFSWSAIEQRFATLYQRIASPDMIDKE